MLNVHAQVFKPASTTMTTNAPVSSTTPKKRSRTESNHASPEKYHRSKDIWYEDGNIILIAQNVAFKVHRSVLALCSDVFRDMFEVAQPGLRVADPLATPEALPVVHLSDTVKELVTFLNIIYIHGKDPYFRVTNIPAPMAWVSTLLRLGRKYQVPVIADEAIRRLKLVCPGHPSNDYLDGEDDMIDDYAQGEGAMAITIVNLARAFDLPELLPVALYRCCQVQTDTLIHGVALEDGTRERLSPEDLVCCLDSKEKILKLNYDFSETMRSDTGCGDCFEDIRLSKEALFSYNILFNTFEISDESNSPCSECRDDHRNNVRQLQRNLFDDLSEIFELA